MLQEGREIQAEYERVTLNAATGGEDGAITGVLATDGEASDGDILDIDGGQVPKTAPLLFGHQDWSGDRNLGSWTKFEKTAAANIKTPLGGKAVRGDAQIEMDGPEGTDKDWRHNMAFMVGRKHINGLSVRWSPVGDPIRRVNLPSDHPAFVDANTATGNKRWGLFFPKWKLLEGSIVTLGADPAALIGRMRESKGDVRKLWRACVNDTLMRTVSGGEDMVGVQLANGETAFTERAIYDALLELANERMNTALDLHEELHEEKHRVVTDEEVRAMVERVNKVTPGKEDDVPGNKEPAGTSRSALEFDAGELEFPTAVDALTTGLLEALADSDKRWEDGVRDLTNALTGKL